MNENKDILNSEEIEALAKEFAERLTRQQKANEIYETFLKSYGLATMEYETVEIDGEVCQTSKLGEGKVELKSDDYPDYYGGAYIDDCGELVIHIVGDLDSCQGEIKKVINQKEGYSLQQAAYSYKELLELKDYLEELSVNDKQSEIFSNIVGYGPDDRNNLFLIEMNILNKEHIAKFKENISDSDMIIFKQGGKAVEETTVRPGRIITRSTVSASTLTIRARRRNDTTNRGFIMSGHATQGVGDVIRLNGSSTTIIGRVRNRNVGGSADAAYAERENTSITLSQEIEQNRLILSNARTTAAVGTTVHLAGHRSGIRTGQILQVNRTTGGITNTSRASYFSQDGDSGGPIYIATNTNTTNFLRHIVGIHIGSSIVESTGQRLYGFFGLIANPLNFFGLELF